MADEHVVQLLDTNTANQIAAGEVWKSLLR